MEKNFFRLSRLVRFRAIALFTAISFMTTFVISPSVFAEQDETNLSSSKSNTHKELSNLPAAQQPLNQAGMFTRKAQVESFPLAQTNSSSTSQATLPSVTLISPTTTNEFIYELIYAVNGVKSTEYITLSEGENIINRTFQNQTGNVATAHWVVTLDTTKPVLTGPTSLRFCPDAAIREKLLIRFDSNKDVAWKVDIEDLKGKATKSFQSQGETFETKWDGIDSDSGKPYATGVYSIRVEVKDRAMNKMSLSVPLAIHKELSNVAPESQPPNHAEAFMNKTERALPNLPAEPQSLSQVKTSTNKPQVKQIPLVQTNSNPTSQTALPSVTLISPTTTNKINYELAYAVNGVKSTEYVVLNDGKNNIDRVFQDRVGNKAVVRWVVTLDTTKPILTGPASLRFYPDKMVREKLLIRFTANKHVSWRVNIEDSKGKTVKSFQTQGETFETKWNGLNSESSDFYTAGIYTIRVEAEDHATNKSSLSIPVAIHTTEDKDKLENSATQRVFVYINGKRLAMEENGTKYFFLQDHLGSTDTVLNEQGEKISYTEYRPFGAIKLEEATFSYSKKFNAKELDDSTGLYYYGARYYEPTIAHFITPDVAEPNLKDPQTLNPYSYTLNNPLKYIDPTGHTAALALPFLIPGYGGILIGATILVFVAMAALESLPQQVARGIQGTGPVGASALVTPGVTTHENLPPITSTGPTSGAMTLASGKEDTNFQTQRTVIGKMKDLNKPGSLRQGERQLDLPDLGNPKANWKQNSSRLREAMRSGEPIRDASVDQSGRLRDNTGFLRAERNLIVNKGWRYEQKTNLWTNSSLGKEEISKPIFKKAEM